MKGFLLSLSRYILWGPQFTGGPQGSQRGPILTDNSKIRVLEVEKKMNTPLVCKRRLLGALCEFAMQETGVKPLGAVALVWAGRGRALAQPADSQMATGHSFGVLVCF